MRILLTGRNGQVGWELQRSLLPLGQVIALGRDDADLANPKTLRWCVEKYAPDVIVNAAAYTAVDKAEAEETLAMKVNAEAPAVLAEEAQRCNALLIHYSTDYVFDGRKDGPYVEDDAPAPLNAYGRSKLAGEQAITEAGCDYLIFRTSWVYSHRGSNFVHTIRRLARERNELSIVGDQVGTPTWARHIADVTAHGLWQADNERSAGSFESGLFHLTSHGETSWHGFAATIMQLENERGRTYDCSVNAIRSDEYPTAAVRPMNSRLCVDKLEKRFGLKMPEWQVPLGLCLESIVD